MQLKDAAVLVTGASRGLGAALATRLAEIGREKVVLVARHADSLNEVTERIRANSGRAFAVPGDVAKKEEDIPCNRGRGGGGSSVHIEIFSFTTQ